MGGLHGSLDARGRAHERDGQGVSLRTATFRPPQKTLLGPVLSVFHATGGCDVGLVGGWVGGWMSRKEGGGRREHHCRTASCRIFFADILVSSPFHEDIVCHSPIDQLSNVPTPTPTPTPTPQPHPHPQPHPQDNHTSEETKDPSPTNPTVATPTQKAAAAVALLSAGRKGPSDAGTVARALCGNIELVLRSKFSLTGEGVEGGGMR